MPAMVHRALLSRVLTVALVLGTAPAAADTLACYASGSAAMRADDHARAAEAFHVASTDAACASARPGLIYNEAVAWERLAETLDTSEDDAPICRALYAYRRALAIADAATRPAILTAIERLQPRCPPAGSLRIVCEPEGGSVSLHGRVRHLACPADFDDLRPRTWRGEVIVGGRAVPFEVSVPTGQRVVHRVLTAPEPPIVAPQPEPPPPAEQVVDEAPPPPPPLAPYGWAAIAAGAASAGVAVYAYSESRTLVDRARRANEEGRADDWRRGLDDYEHNEVVYVSSMIAAGVLVSTGITLLLLDGDEDRAVEPVVGAISGIRVRFWP